MSLLPSSASVPPYTPAVVTLQMLRSQGLISAIEGDPQTKIQGVQHDSRKVQPGDLFVAIEGAAHEGSHFVDEAKRRGAVAVLSRRRLNTALAQAIAAEPRLALGQVAAVVYGHPTQALRVIGITGTNGKTTVSYLLEAAIAASGGVAAVMGTIAQRGPKVSVAATHTTPEGDDIARFARTMVDRGVTHLIMEVSSHALALHRVDAVHFAVAAFTNLSQDHLDFHGEMERYFEAKQRLFKYLSPETSVINVDDPYGRAILASAPGRLIRCSLQADAQDADLCVLSYRLSLDGSDLRLRTPEGEFEGRIALVGLHNVHNVVIALGCAHALGLDLQRALEGMAALDVVPGRLQRIASERGPAVFVDYAHTPAALQAALNTLGTVHQGRKIVVFGCGGERDQSKRAAMGRIAAQAATVVVLTNDNPRSESPARILDAIEHGVRSVRQDRLLAADLAEATHGYAVVEDRRQAIECAINAARDNDVVLIAGKGHEDYQLIGSQRHPFSDVKVAEALLHRKEKR